MSLDTLLLAATAAAVGFLHTLLGPDHYVPFVAMGRARRWPVSKTLTVTALCGVAHVLSSVALGVAGIAFGVALSRIRALESIRESLAGWMLTAFGFAYLLWGLRRVWRNRPHAHAHVHENAPPHSHVAHPRPPATRTSTMPADAILWRPGSSS